MALASLKELLSKAEDNDYAVGAFSIINMETVMGAVKAAEELRSPIILQIAEARLKHAPIGLAGPMMVEAAKAASVPVAVHLDHGLSPELISKTIDMGFTSVMYDGSGLELRENLERTRRICRLAHDRGVDCEGEIGRVGKSEDGSEDHGVSLTSPEEAARFAQYTGVDALAVAIGNQHGVYREDPRLDFARLKEIDAAVSAPLVLHGGSGISAEDFRRCIDHGIRKINVATATLRSVVKRAAGYLKAAGGEGDFFAYHSEVIMGAYESVRDHILIFKSDNRA